MQPAMYVFPAEEGGEWVSRWRFGHGLGGGGPTFCLPARIRIAERQAEAAQLAARPGLDGAVAAGHKVALGLCVFGIVAGAVRDAGIDGRHDGSGWWGSSRRRRGCQGQVRDIGRGRTRREGRENGTLCGESRGDMSGGMETWMSGRSTLASSAPMWLRDWASYGGHSGAANGSVALGRGLRCIQTHHLARVTGEPPMRGRDSHPSSGPATDPMQRGQHEQAVLAISGHWRAAPAWG